MMSLMSELAQMVQRSHARNPDLAFLASDCGRTNYALVAHGTYQDSACNPDYLGAEHVRQLSKLALELQLVSPERPSQE